MCKIGVLRKCSNSVWTTPIFIIPKKNGAVRFVSDFRYLNKCLVRRPYLIPKITDIIRKLEGIYYATSLSVNVDYYIVGLNPYSQKLCTIITPWRKYQYLRLLMGVNVSPGIFEEKMSELMSAD